MKVRRGILLLLGLVALYGVSKVLSKGGGADASRSQRAAEMFEERARGGASGRKAARLMDPPRLRLAALEGVEGGESFSVGRNLFRYAPPKPPEASPGGRPGAGGPGGKAPAPPPEALTPPPPVQPPAPPKPQPPAVTVRYLGAFGPEGKMLAVFTDGGEIYNVFAGETFASRYILRRINLETVELGFVGFPEDITEKLEVGP